MTATLTNPHSVMDKKREINPKTAKSSQPNHDATNVEEKLREKFDSSHENRNACGKPTNSTQNTNKNN